jgi:hypothetical protein
MPVGQVRFDSGRLEQLDGAHQTITLTGHGFDLDAELAQRADLFPHPGSCQPERGGECFAGAHVTRREQRE